ncbi:G/U mismatch-specific DNA glycosylase [Haloplasma contractile]|uniref:G-U mismatch-specific DNA glycosylase protein n=1 Tax=Haloplasma contractile SSD-17B TaxID=1033810 RepID=U2FEI7_9MOLU|nr:G/U mismatch-specific DNA glycosylase [Haloplasma contractile]ERJ11365.1 G-U mismatch-specific DNA glycosylase protein [Haloplasma contractile SSD-17B]
MNPINDHLKRNLNILFVGYNPSLRSAETGYHYANPSNRFWKILYRSGLTPRKYNADENDKLLELGYGLTNIVSRPTRAASDITKDEYIQGKTELIEKIKYYQPKIICFVGKGVYLKYSGKKKAGWGMQDESVVPGIIDYVAPSSSGLVRMKIEDVVKIYSKLAKIK